MTREGWLTMLALAAGLVWAIVGWTRRKRSASPDGDWGVLTRCATCRSAVPRWFLLDKGSPRGAYSRYRHPIPPSCRICRHAGAGLLPLAWQPKESEWQYDQRMEAHAKALMAKRAG